MLEGIVKFLAQLAGSPKVAIATTVLLKMELQDDPEAFVKFIEHALEYSELADIVVEDVVDLLKVAASKRKQH
ncbi:uncharacterized [Tachysurus ichikawai]